MGGEDRIDGREGMDRRREKKDKKTGRISYREERIG